MPLAAASEQTQNEAISIQPPSLPLQVQRQGSMKAVFAGKAQPGAVGAARRLLASGLAIVTVNSPATHHALKEAGIAHQDVRGTARPSALVPPNLCN